MPAPIARKYKRKPYIPKINTQPSPVYTSAPGPDQPVYEESLAELLQWFSCRKRGAEATDMRELAASSLVRMAKLADRYIESRNNRLEHGLPATVSPLSHRFNQDAI